MILKTNLWLKTYLFLFITTAISCNNYGQLKVITDLPKSLKENSGMVSLKDSTVWLIEDSGNKDEIYKVDFHGKIVKTLKVKNAKNKDWEDLAKDDQGNVYIGDIGNNANERKRLTIYKVPNPEIEPGDKIDAEKITFSYPEQTEFPPHKAERLYDAEALFHHGSQLYIITKNRSNPFTGEALVYTVPDSEGSYEAKLISRLKLCNTWKTCQITGMDISPKGDRIVALSYGKLFVFSEFSWDDFTKGKIEEIDLGTRTQLESVFFMNENTLLLSDERSHGRGGNLYYYNLPKEN
ncbi:hypothetical protein [Maribacter thermophilus]|uniref:hypothetical protein n=1 Tax=Maribacter thermophilus TaxID=1197874 RepID=UPI00064175DB|nr:hypothetical protein [Maribacter thermophilus]